MLVGLVGMIGAGKGACGDILVQRGFQKESFASAVKDALAPIFGWDRAMLEGDTPESRAWREQPDLWWQQRLGRPFTPRHALQLMGTEAGRNVFHEDIWVLSMEKRLLDPNKNYVITDTRFPNEIDMIHRLGGKVFRIRRGVEPVWYNDAYRSNVSGSNIQKLIRFPEVHYSEWAWIGCNLDAIITNDGSLKDLEEVLLTLI